MGNFDYSTGNKYESPGYKCRQARRQRVSYISEIIKARHRRGSNKSITKFR